ncbi:glycosyltransferase, partial [bacterium]|nr:glycosyltransferase [bacterium]
MKILHCIPNMAGGGAERQLTYLVKAQRELGLDVQVVLIGGGPNLDQLQSTGVTVHLLKKRGNHDPLILLRILRLATRFRPDIIQTWLRQMDILGGMCSMLLGIPFVLSERSCKMAYTRAFKWRLRELIARKSAAVIANSPAGIAYWKEVLPRQHACFWLPNAVPVEEIASATPLSLHSYGIPDNVPRILFVGRFSKEKRVGFLIEAFSLVAKRTKAVLILCGEGNEDAVLRKRVHEDPGLRERVFFLPYQKNVWGLMKKCQLFASLSSFEGCPNAVLEAAVCGLRLLLSDIAPHREVVGNNAYYTSGSLAETADCLVRALADLESNYVRPGSERSVLHCYSPPEIALRIN